ncbi:MAG: type II and III secretion system protein [Verrucomicrobia bacterium]|nr:type II and III secretion system protein [Verrucomicrobiota bacterium]MBU1908875.1 type II and III secretion system protein [Verrucomicrobiota bacterium]
MKALLIIALLSAVSLASLAQQDQNLFEVYPLGFADGRSAVEMVKAMVGSTGNVSLDEKNRRLLVFTTEEKHNEVANLMRKLNVAPKNVRIDVRFSGTSRRQDTGAGIGASGGMVREEGITRTRIRVSPRIENTTITTSSDVTQTLLVASGREGILRVGESVPYVDWLVDYGLQWGYLQQRISYRDVGSSLIVEPTVIGDGPLVRIRLTPELSGLVDGNVYRTRFARVATEVTVQDGQTFQIGGLDKDSEFYSRFLIGFDRSGNRQALDITLTPHIVSASGGP